MSKNQEKTLYTVLSIIGTAGFFWVGLYMLKRERVKKEMIVSSTASEYPELYPEQFSPTNNEINNAIIFEKIFDKKATRLFSRIAPGMGLVTTSWWRSPRLNKAVGGVDNSPHLFGFAKDYVVGNGTKLENQAFFNFLQLNEDKFPKVSQVALEDDHVHVAVDPLKTNSKIKYYA